MNEKTSINSIYPNLWAPTAGLLQDLTLQSVCLPDKVQECLWSQEATGKVWIGLEQNIIVSSMNKDVYIIDTAVNELRRRLLACVHIVGQHFKQFYCRQLKNKQLDEMSAKVLEMWTKYVFTRYVN